MKYKRASASDTGPILKRKLASLRKKNDSLRQQAVDLLLSIDCLKEQGDGPSIPAECDGNGTASPRVRYGTCRSRKVERGGRQRRMLRGMLSGV